MGNISNREEIQLIVQIARLYYENDQTQEQIAQRLQITRQKVSRLLIEARSQGIVQISINDPTQSDPKLSEVMRKTFNLRRVILIASEGLEGEQLRSQLGIASAEILGQIMTDDQIVGIGWGRTLYHAINSLSRSKQCRIHVVPLIGGIGDMASFFQVNDLVKGLAEAFNGTFRSIYAPAFIPDEQTRNGLVKSQELGTIVEAWDQLNSAIIGIGHVEFQKISSMFFADHISSENLAKLESKGAVGDILGRFFDSRGAQVEINAGVISISLEQLKAIPDVIAIAGGIEKARAILGALRGGYIKTLVTDIETARAVLSENEVRR